MSILYDLFKNPPRSTNEDTLWLHARPKVIGTWKTDDIAERINHSSSFTASDLKGLLEGLSQVLSEGLSSSHNVYLEGIGTFSVSLQSKPVKDKKDIRASSIQIKGIHFKPDPALKKKLKASDIKRVSDPHKRVKPDEEGRKNRILHYLRKKGSINITTAMQLNNCNHAKASRDLNCMVENNDIQVMQSGKLKIYYLKN